MTDLPIDPAYPRNSPESLRAEADALDAWANAGVYDDDELAQASVLRAAADQWDQTGVSPDLDRMGIR